MGWYGSFACSLQGSFDCDLVLIWLKRKPSQINGLTEQASLWTGPEREGGERKRERERGRRT